MIQKTSILSAGFRWNNDGAAKAAPFFLCNLLFGMAVLHLKDGNKIPFFAYNYGFRKKLT